MWSAEKENLFRLVKLENETNHTSATPWRSYGARDR